MPKSSEFRSYNWINSKLKEKGWNVANPNDKPRGEVWVQNECLRHPEIKKALSLEKPENVVKITTDTFWIIEAKEGLRNLDRAYKEAVGYAKSINSKSKWISAPIVSGVAGNDTEGYDVRTGMLIQGKWEQVRLGKHSLHRLLSKNEILQLLDTKSADLKKPEPSIQEITELSKKINEVLHKAKVTKEKRALYVAILLLALSEDSTLKLGESSKVFIKDVNARAEAAFSSAGKQDLWEHIRVKPSSESVDEQANALNKIIFWLKESDLLYSSHTSDVLGSFFEGFLRYGNTSKELGIVLTPRHICWLASESLEINDDDVLYDPAAGTGGFLISAFNRIKKLKTDAAAKRFAQKNIFGAEDSDTIAALAFINMYFRGDGKHNLKIDSCFDWQIGTGSKKTKYPNFISTYSSTGERSDIKHRRVSKVLMNPPFALKNDKQKEPDFIDHALNQMIDNGLLFAVLPSSVLYESKFKKWRESLLQEHTLQSVILFPGDLFYPVATETIGLFVKKGCPHERTGEVLWARISDDGFVKRKGFRVEKTEDGYQAFLKRYVERIRAWVIHGTKLGEIEGEIEFQPLQSHEFIPQAHLGSPKLNEVDFHIEVQSCLRGLLNNTWAVMGSRKEESHGKD